MRYLILLLILVNVAFFIWYPDVRSGPHSTPRLPPLPPHAQQLMLLSERGSIQAEQPAEQAGSAGETAGPAAKPAGRAETVASADAPADTAAAEPAEQTPPPRPRLCRTIGPYFDEKSARKAVKELAKEKYEVRIRNGNIQAPAGYWVYLPSMETAEARKIVKDLDARGMDDYYIGKDNVISLGIFSGRDTAEARRGAIAKLGYSPMLDQRYRTRKVFWLDLEDGDKPLLINPVWNRLLKEDPNIAAQQVSCE